MGGVRPPRRRRDPRRRLLGVTPVEDPGQPVRLALAPPRRTGRRSASPAPIPRRRAGSAGPAAPAAPVRIAEARPAEAPAFWVPTAQSYQAPPEAPVERGDCRAEPAAPPPEVRVQYASAARTLVAPEPALIRAAAVNSRAGRRLPARPPAGRDRERLGARSSSSSAPSRTRPMPSAPGSQASGRYGLEGRRPLTTTIDINGRTPASRFGLRLRLGRRRPAPLRPDPRPGRRLLRPRQCRRRLDPLGRAATPIRASATSDSARDLRSPLGRAVGGQARRPFRIAAPFPRQHVEAGHAHRDANLDLLEDRRARRDRRPARPRSRRRGSSGPGA